ncbi:DUF3499 domain-containing protein [Corynebacterium aquatimens]|uniref:DUF3499 domain-containing protein n=1 Tax=Corynebacterium aquatimens TaxID=1190508 RepID=A0A931GY29_9CORY|nr:DUF3499 domain-containing protein [Corynebacterium aquatimens]MBG6123149.1 hypothetical protein [Corynebacterium aquatimens]
MNHFRRCCRPGCGRPATSTLVYAYSESTAIVGPLTAVPEPHAWDLCQRHSENISAPVGWDLVRIDHVAVDDDPELTALAEAVREAGRVTTGLVDTARDPIEYDTKRDYTDPETSNHPIYRTKRVGKTLSEHKAARRAHLTVVPDPEQPRRAENNTENTENTDNTENKDDTFS